MLKNLLLSIAFLSTFFSFSQNKLRERIVTHFLGLQFGPTTGIGASYTFFKGKTGLRATAFGYKRASLIDLNGGMTLIHKLVEREKVDLYSYLATRCTYKHELALKFNQNTENIDILNQREIRVNSSLGLGLNIKVNDHFEISTQVGYGLFNMNSQESIIFKNWFHLFMRHPSYPWNMITGAVGISYKISKK